jgi:hypothetical protein
MMELRNRFNALPRLDEIEAVILKPNVTFLFYKNGIARYKYLMKLS